MISLFKRSGAHLVICISPKNATIYTTSFKMTEPYNQTWLNKGNTGIKPEEMPAGQWY